MNIIKKKYLLYCTTFILILIFSIIKDSMAFTNPIILTADGQIVRKIIINGLKKIETDVVLAYLPKKIDDVLNNETISTSVIHALYNTGFFKNVKIQIDDQNLIFQLEEYPIISKIEFIGIKKFDKNELRKGLKAINISESLHYNQFLLDKAVQELKNQYMLYGFYNVNVFAKISPVDENCISITFTIQEGKLSKIEKINIIGNNTFSSDILFKEMQLSKSNWLSWYTKNDIYSKQKLNSDLESIRSFYFNRGYLDFLIESIQISSISPEKNDIYLTIILKEGQQYILSSIQLIGDVFNKEKEFAKLIQPKPGKIFSSIQFSNSTRDILSRLYMYGYPFSAIQTQTNLNKDRCTVDLTLNIRAGNRTYVRYINIIGNTKTHDYVIRREIRQLENSWLDMEKLKLSKDKISRLGFFKEVDIKIKAVPQLTDEVDIDVLLQEKSTGSLSIGAGFSSTDKVILSGSISQENIFGTGTSIDLNINTGKINKVLSLSSYDPYFFDNGISRYTEFYTRNTYPLFYNNDTEYRINNTGGNLKFGIPYSEETKIFFGIGLEQLKIKKTVNTPTSYQNYIKEYGAQNFNVPATISLSKDTRNNIFIPSSGKYQQIHYELGTILGNMEYYRISYQHQFFYHLNKNGILSFNNEIGYGGSYTNKLFPITKNHFLGGIGSIRGFQPGSIGPYEIDNIGIHRPIGGASKLLSNIEYTVPLPGSGIDRSLRLFSFIDIGNLYKDIPNFSNLRSSCGFGISWISPIGPIKFGYGFPIRKKYDDRTQHFQFQIGTIF